MRKSLFFISFLLSACLIGGCSTLTKKSTPDYSIERTGKNLTIKYKEKIVKTYRDVQAKDCPEEYVQKHSIPPEEFVDEYSVDFVDEKNNIIYLSHSYVIGAENAWDYIAFNFEKGWQHFFNAKPIWSPSRTRFVVVDFFPTGDFDTEACQIWHMEKGKMVKKWYRTRGATSAKWHSDDSLTIYKDVSDFPPEIAGTTNEILNCVYKHSTWKCKKTKYDYTKEPKPKF
jgi:hypothetical protein